MKPTIQTSIRRAVAGAVLVAALAPASSLAAPGVMTVYACGTPERATGSADRFAQYNAVGPYSATTVSTCSTTGVMTVGPGAHAHNYATGDGSALDYSAPAGTRVKRVLLDARIQVSWRDGTGGEYGALAFIPRLVSNATGFMDWCKGNNACFGMSGFPVGAVTRDAYAQYSNLNESLVRLDVRCDDGNSCHANATEPIQARVNRAEVDLAESPAAAPTSSGVQGSLVSDPSLRGTEDVTFSASDNAAGIYRAVAIVDGGDAVPLALDGSTPTCVDARPGDDNPYEFEDSTPCPTNGSFSAGVDTTKLGDGEHTINIYVEDATGLRSKVLGRAVTVRNAPDTIHPPSIGGIHGPIAAGDTLTCDPGSFSPAPDSISYAWLVDGAVVPGSTGSSYTVRTADLGHSIVCRVTATKYGGPTVVDSGAVGGSGQPGEQPPPDACTGQPSGPTDPCGDFDHDGIRNKDDADDDNDGTPDTSDPAPFNASVTSSVTTTSSVTNTTVTNNNGGGSDADRDHPAVTQSDNGRPNNGDNASNRARVLLSASTRRTLGFRKRFHHTGVLRDENGRAISGASLTVMQRMSVPGAPWTVAREPLRTDADGRFAWTIPAGYGRTIRYAYKANLTNADFQATADLVLSVRSRTTLRTNRRFLHNGQTVRFSGALASKPVPAGGVLIDLQAKAGRRWITFKTTRTKRSGRWSSKYRFHATTGLQTYAFRVRVRQDSAYPYGISTSKAVKVRVRG